MEQGVVRRTQGSAVFLYPQPETAVSERAEGHEQTEDNEQGGEETVQGKVKWVSGEEADQVSLVHTQCC